MLISTDTENAWQNPTAIQDFKMKQNNPTLSQLRTDRTFLRLIRNIFKKPTANITFDREKLAVFLPRSGK